MHLRTCAWLLALLCLPIAASMASMATQPPAAGTASAPTTAQTSARRAWTRAQAVPVRLDPRQPLATSADLQRIDAAIGSARIVAVGEPAHGAHEPLAFRNRLFRHLVEQRGFTAITIESGFSESRRLDDYVLGRNGGHIDAAAVSQAGFSWGFGGYAENIELLQWMRRYNQDPAHPRKLRIYGIDLSGGDRGEFPHARIALDDAIAYLRQAAPVHARSLLAELEAARDGFDFAAYRAASGPQRSHLHATIDRLLAWIERERVPLAAATSEDAQAWAQRNASVARQLLQSFRAWPADASGAAPSAGLEHVVSARDAAMADNVLWALQREGEHGRVLLFAHNAHVASAALSGGMWSAFASAPTMMGQHLRPALGADLRIIGALHADNGPGLDAAIANPAGLDDQLAGLVGGGADAFVLDLRQADADPDTAAWLARAQPIRTNFTTSLQLSPRRAFDLVVFFRQLTPAGTTATPTATAAPARPGA